MKNTPFNLYHSNSDLNPNKSKLSSLYLNSVFYHVLNIQLPPTILTSISSIMYFYSNPLLSVCQHWISINQVKSATSCVLMENKWHYYKIYLQKFTCISSTALNRQLEQQCLYSLPRWIRCALFYTYSKFTFYIVLFILLSSCLQKMLPLK